MIGVVFVWESNNGVLTLEIPYGWDTPKKRGGHGDSPLTQWKKQYRKELDELRNLTRDDLALRLWIKEKQKESILNLYHLSKRW